MPQSTLEIHFEKHPFTSQSVIWFVDIASVLANQNWTEG